MRRNFSQWESLELCCEERTEGVWGLEEKIPVESEVGGKVDRQAGGEEIVWVCLHVSSNERKN